MKKWLKTASEAFFWVGVALCMGRTVKMAPAPCFSVFLAVLVLLLTPFSTATAQERKTRMITFQASGLKTAAISQSSPFEVSAYTEGQVFIGVTAEVEPSTLDIVIQVSPDQATWFTHTTVGQISATGQYRAAITNFGNYIRVQTTVGGTSMTFSVVGVFKN